MTQDNENSAGDRDVPAPTLRDLPAPDPGLARERTSLAWTRTAIGFAALGGVVLKENVITGLIILAIAPVVWRLGRVAEGHGPARDLPRVGAPRLFFMAITIVTVALLCLFISIFGKSVPGALR